MADDPTITLRVKASSEQTTGGVAAKEIDGKLHQYIRIDKGDAIRVPVTDADPLPVEGTVAIAGTAPISAVALPLPTGAASESKLAELDNATDAWIATQSGSTGTHSLVT